MRMETWNQVEKNQARSIVCKNRGKAFQNIVLLPSDTILDVEELLKNRMILPGYTRITAIERDPAKAEIIEEKLTALNVPHKVICKELVDVNLAIEAEDIGYRFDFLYLDTCSQLTPKMLTWLCSIRRDYYKIFSNKCVLSLAFCSFTRVMKSFMDSFRRRCGKQQAFKHMSLDNSPQARTMPDTTLGDINFEAQIPHYRTLRNMLSLLFGKPDSAIWYKNEESRNVMTVFEFAVDGSRISSLGIHVKFVEDFLANHKSAPAVKLPKTPESKKVKGLNEEIRKSIKRIKVKVDSLNTDQKVSLAKDYKYKLAGWKMSMTKKRATEEDKAKHLIEKSIEYSCANGYDKGIVELLYRAIK